MSLRGIGSIVCVGLLAFAARTAADDLVVRGVVTGTDEAPLEGAVVTVSTGWGGADVVADTTGADGSYLITTTVEPSFGGTAMLVLTAAADGYQGAQEYTTVSDANDGEADTVEQDFALTAGDSPGEGDTLVLTGTVTDESEQPIEGAEVTVTLGFGGAQEASATTGTDGTYRVVLVNGDAMQGGAVTVSADGYRNAQEYIQIESPSDGVTDVVEQDFALTGMSYDTITVTGTVVDAEAGEPIEGATVTVTSSGGMWGGGDAVSAEGTTGADGSFSVSLIAGRQLERVSWSVAHSGYETEEGIDGVGEDGQVDIGTVELIAYSSTDTISYAISGTVTDEQGDGVGGATVIVTMSRDGADIFVDTVTTVAYGFVQGRYQVQSEQPYVEGDITVTVRVTAEGFEPAEESESFAASTSEITLDVELTSTDTRVTNLPAVTRRAAGPVRIYRPDGRLMSASAGRRTGLHGPRARQVLIMREEASRTARGVVVGGR